MRIDVRGSQELRDIILAINQSDREVRRAIRTFTKARLVRPWLEAINSQASTVLENRVLAATATVAVSDQNIKITSAAKGRKLSGGLLPKVEYPAVEFGTNRNRVDTYTRGGGSVRAHTRGGRRVRAHTRSGGKVTRNTTAQFRPRNQKGYVFYPAATRMIPRLASLWVQTVVKTYADIFDGR